MAQLVRCKNQIRAVLRENDRAGAKWLWSKHRIAWLESLELHDAARLRLDLAIEQFKSLTQKIKRLERLEAELQKYADRHPAVRLLMTIPGAWGSAPPRPSWRGWTTSRVFAAHASAGGLLRPGAVPGRASADQNRLGHITRDGPPVMRKLITEAAWTAIKKCPAFKSYFERITAGKPERKKIAIVAAAQRMIRVMGAMMRSGTVYETPTTKDKDEEPLRGVGQRKQSSVSESRVKFERDWKRPNLVLPAMTADRAHVRWMRWHVASASEVGFALTRADAASQA